MFSGGRRIAVGDRRLATEAVLKLLATDPNQSVLTFDALTGAVVDLDLRPGAADAEPKELRRGRPKLGVVAREVTLLPRHWDWLSSQPGGASTTLRRLVSEAMKVPSPASRLRMDAAYRFMSAIAGDLPGFEEASRALFAEKAEELRARLSDWPADIVAEVLRLCEFKNHLD